MRERNGEKLLESYVFCVSPKYRGNFYICIASLYHLLMGVD